MPHLPKQSKDDNDREYNRFVFTGDKVKAHNIVCECIQRAWREFATKTDRRSEEPHSDWAMIATLIAWDVIASSIASKHGRDLTLDYDRFNKIIKMNFDARYNRKD